MKVHESRFRKLNEKPLGTGAVVYWMQRDQRVEDNWALLYALEQATARATNIVVVFTLQEIPHRTQLRHYDFMLKGLAEVAEVLQQYRIPFHILRGDPVTTLEQFVITHDISEVVTDFSPLHYARKRRDTVAEALPITVTEVDAHNIVPCWIASDKEEFAAYTFRPKIHKKLGEYLTEYPSLVTQQQVPTQLEASTIQWDELMQTLQIGIDAQPVTWLKPGARAAQDTLQGFIDSRLPHYADKRNDPNESVLSQLSPYLHFGHISAQRVALTVREVRGAGKDNKDAFLEELIVRRELADNYCFYNTQHAQVAGAHAWAQKTIVEHAHDVREYEYTKEQLEYAHTHDELWNAMQKQMVLEGKMHGWCRMYWAKKILEWTPDTQTAIDIALYLNDKYELDGNDPNGVVGVMWSICGVHDRAWNERPIFGKIRYMNFSGAKRKFDVSAYIERYDGTQNLFDES